MEKFIFMEYEGQASSRMRAILIEAENEEKAWEQAEEEYQGNMNTLHLLTVKEAEDLMLILKLVIQRAKS